GIFNELSVVNGLFIQRVVIVAEVASPTRESRGAAGVEPQRAGGERQGKETGLTNERHGGRKRVTSLAARSRQIERQKSERWKRRHTGTGGGERWMGRPG
ncbi:hypothetical protein T310_5855, partial [Rasamsonia emersonii CBS 393.64]